MTKIITYIGLLLSTMVLFTCGSNSPDYKPNVKYEKDSVYFRAVVRKMMTENIDPFHNVREFDQNSSLFIDTILYSKDSLKAMLLVITVTSDTKTHPVYDNFHGNYFFAGKTGQKSRLKSLSTAPGGYRTMIPTKMYVPGCIKNVSETGGTRNGAKASRSIT